MQSETAAGKTPEVWQATVETMIGMGADACVSYGRNVVDIDAEAGALQRHFSPRLPGLTAGSLASSGGRALAS